MSEVVIHSIPGSPFGRAVLVALEEKGTGYRLAPVAPGTMRSPEHLARHPFGRVPILDHGDFRLYESQAILRYVDRVWPQPALTPADPRADFFELTPEWQPLTAKHGNLREWLSRMQARPSMAATTWERVAALAAAA